MTAASMTSLRQLREKLSGSKPLRTTRSRQKISIPITGGRADRSGVPAASVISYRREQAMPPSQRQISESRNAVAKAITVPGFVFAPQTNTFRSSSRQHDRVAIIRPAACVSNRCSTEQSPKYRARGRLRTRIRQLQPVGRLLLFQWLCRINHCFQFDLFRLVQPLEIGHRIQLTLSVEIKSSLLQNVSRRIAMRRAPETGRNLL